MTLKEMRQLLLSFLDEDGVRRDDNTLNNSLNEGYLLTSMLTQAYELTKTMQLPAGRSFYYLPSDFFLPISVFVDGNRLYAVTMDELDQLNTSWFLSNTFGTPLYYFTIGNLTTYPQLWLYPKPNQTVSLTLTYAAVPNRMTSDSDVPRIPNEHHMALVYWAFAWELLKERGNEVIEKTVRVFQQYVDAAMKLRQHIYNRNPDRDVQTPPWDLRVFEQKLRKLKGRLQLEESK